MVTPPGDPHALIHTGSAAATTTLPMTFAASLFTLLGSQQLVLEQALQELISKNKTRRQHSLQAIVGQHFPVI